MDGTYLKDKNGTDFKDKGGMDLKETEDGFQR